MTEPSRRDSDSEGQSLEGHTNLFFKILKSNFYAASNPCSGNLNLETLGPEF